jgi:hypothetical protein
MLCSMEALGVLEEDRQEREWEQRRFEWRTTLVARSVSETGRAQETSLFPECTALTVCFECYIL